MNKPLHRGADCGTSAISLRAGRFCRFLLLTVAVSGVSAQPSDTDLESGFGKTVRPFVEDYCLKCHDTDAKKGDLDLSTFHSLDEVVSDYQHWELVLERLENGDMPPAKSKKQPTQDSRKRIVSWIRSVRENEARKNTGDPGPVPARRLSNAEFDYTIRDLTGVDIRPARSFPVDPANQAGFDNSAESLAMSPALLKKYLEAAKEVADHLVLTPDGFEFASHPVITDTDRDKWSVFRIVNFYRKQPIDYVDYFLAAWKYKHRSALKMPDATLEQIAADSKISAKYLALIWSTLSGADADVGPISVLQEMWSELPEPGNLAAVRSECEQMREYVSRVRERIVPVVKNLTASPIHPGSQTLVMWKNREMAANRRRFDPGALQSSTSVTNDAAPAAPVETKKQSRASNTNRPRRHIQEPTPERVQKGGFALPPTLLTTESSATAKMAAAKNHSVDPDLFVPEDPAERAKYEAAFARFANIFPDAFYITERARVYLDAEKEKENAGRLLSAGLHSMTGYFRDDQPLYDLILDEAGQREIDRLWDEFNFVSSVPQRMHTSLVWFERTDSGYLRDPEFDAYRPEDKSINTQEKIRAFARLYLDKAQRNNASEAARNAIKEHFDIVARTVQHVDDERVAAVPKHLAALEAFATRAYRRPLAASERADLREFYETAMAENGMDHEQSIRDCIARVLMSPNFSFRMDLVMNDVAGSEPRSGGANGNLPTHAGGRAVRPLSDYAIANRLSYFLCASMPDTELLEHAAAGDLHQPAVLKAQSRRMLSDARARNFATEFAGNWLDFRRFEQHNSVDRERFPAFDNELREAMFEEPIRFFLDVVRADRSILDFIYAHDTFVNAPLARHYGIPTVPPDADTWVHIQNADKFNRGGLLPMAVFLTANSPGLRTSPVKRGNWVVKRILGERIPPPPAIVPDLPSDEKSLGKLTLREALAKHRQSEACAGCHSRFDSFGLVFESFGPVGNLRDRDFGGNLVDTLAEFPNGTRGDGLSGLQQYIRGYRQDDYIENFCRKLLAYALGRTLIIPDDLLVKEMRKNLTTNGYRFSSLIDTIVTSPQFLMKRNSEKLAKN